MALCSGKTQPRNVRQKRRLDDSKMDAVSDDLLCPTQDSHMQAPVKIKCQGYRGAIHFCCATVASKLVCLHFQIHVGLSQREEKKNKLFFSKMSQNRHWKLTGQVQN